MQAIEDAVAADFRSGWPWADEPEFPDVVKWQDICHDPQLAASIVARRLVSRTAPGVAHLIPAPKKQAGEARTFTVLHPLDEAAYRYLVGVSIRSIEDQLGEEVLAARMQVAPPAWRLRKFRYGHNDWQNQVESQMLIQPGIIAQTADVKNYFPSVRFERLAEVLAQQECTEVAINGINWWLSQLSELWGTRGLPIGSDGSSVLGNAFLVPVDKALRGAGFGFLRYMDDVVVFASDPGAASEALSRLVDECESLGLALNDEKCDSIQTIDELREHLVDPQLRDLKRRSGEEERAAARGTFEADAASNFPSVPRLNRCLRILARAGDTIPLIFLQADPSAMARAPKEWARYLGSLHERREVDEDWLCLLGAMDSVADRSTPGWECVRIHALRACTARVVGTEAGRLLEATMERPTKSSVRCWIVEAWRNSVRWRLGMAAEAALAEGDGQVRRYLLLSMRGRQSNKRTRALKQLSNSFDDCRPTARWIMSAA